MNFLSTLAMVWMLAQPPDAAPHPDTLVEKPKVCVRFEVEVYKSDYSGETEERLETEWLALVLPTIQDRFGFLEFVDEAAPNTLTIKLVKKLEGRQRPEAWFAITIDGDDVDERGEIDWSFRDFDAYTDDVSVFDNFLVELESSFLAALEKSSDEFVQACLSQVAICTGALHVESHTIALPMHCHMFLIDEERSHFKLRAKLRVGGSGLFKTKWLQAAGAGAVEITDDVESEPLRLYAGRILADIVAYIDATVPLEAITPESELRVTSVSVLRYRKAEACRAVVPPTELNFE